MNNKDKRYMRMALRHAVLHDETLIEAHRVKTVFRKGIVFTVIPVEYKSLCARLRKNIDNYLRLLEDHTLWK